jgi:hypothetical protein
MLASRLGAISIIAALLAACASHRRFALATAAIGYNATIADACDRCNARKIAQTADTMLIAAL